MKMFDAATTTLPQDFHEPVLERAVHDTVLQ
jgi:hypothetical protein